MKLLKTIPLLFSLAVATAQAADVNPHPQSFGTWHDADGGNFVINKNGFKEFAHVPAECGQKSKGYVHESSWISGKELAKSIRESIEIEDSDNKTYGSEMHAILKTIPLLFSLAVATAQAADVNPHPQSFVVCFTIYCHFNDFTSTHIFSIISNNTKLRDRKSVV